MRRAPQNSKKEWKFVLLLFLRSKICVFLFPPFYSFFPERIFFSFLLLFHFVQNYFSPSTQTSAHGLGLVSSKAKAGLNVALSFVQHPHTCFLSLSLAHFLSLAWKFSPRELSRDPLALSPTHSQPFPHYHGSPQKALSRENYVISTCYCEYFLMFLIMPSKREIRWRGKLAATQHPVRSMMMTIIFSLADYFW